MSAPPHPTRDRLLDAALDLADTQPIGDSSVDQITATAGVAKGTFYVHFRSRHEFDAALLTRLDDRLREVVGVATAGMEPGAGRLRVGCEAYLDRCLGLAGIKAALPESASSPSTLARRDQWWIAASAVDLAAMSEPRPTETSRLLVASIRSIATAEQQSGRSGPLRAACWTLFGLLAPEEPR